MLLLIIVLTCFLEGLMGTASSPNPSIIIVGSGPSGIAAATKLLKNNFTNIKILEAENRIGGRINSEKFGDAYVDLGAEFCNGEGGNIVYSMVKDLGILRSHNDNYSFLLSDGEIVSRKLTEKIEKLILSSQYDDEIGEDCENGPPVGDCLRYSKELTEKEIELLESFDFYKSEEIGESCQNVTSVGECLRINHKQLLSTIENPKEKKILELSHDWAKTYLSFVNSPLDLNDLSTETDYKECEGDLGLNWNGLGYKTILEIMMQKYPTLENQLPIDDKIFLQKEVNQISNWRNGEKVSITTTDGSTYEANHVIFTPSVGVLKANYQTLFSPCLPKKKVDAIRNIGFGAIMKIIMHFSERWWKDDASWTFIWTKEDKEKLIEKKLEWLTAISGVLKPENNSNVLIALYGGDQIPFIETLSDDQIREGQNYVINKFLAPSFNVTMPDKILRSTWYSNPHFRGTHSYESVKGYATGGSKSRIYLAKPLLNYNTNPTVLFAGEATHPYYFSTVHGAIESGYREAQRLIDLYQKRS